MFIVKEFRAVVVSVSDLQRSLAFYRDLLGFQVLEQMGEENGLTRTILDAGNGHTIRLLSVSGAARPSQWIPNDLQTGFRHIGFKARDVDATTARLKASGVPFTLNPLDATGGVRIAFFTDPDGTLLEIVQGELQYHVNGPAVGALPPVNPDGDALIFDHVAVSVSSRDNALAYYSDQLGCPMLGELIFNDARGFRITYLKAGTAVLELFSFSTPTMPNYWESDPAVVGIKHIVFEHPGGPDMSQGAAMVNAPDATPLEMVPEPARDEG